MKQVKNQFWKSSFFINKVVTVMLHKKSSASLLTNLLIGLVVLLMVNTSYGQVYGCKDPLAKNYSPVATINDGSCIYDATTYSPPLKTIISDTLIESSGLVMAGNFLWSFNDRGGAAAIYRIDTTTNALLQKVNLSGAVNIDWEDIAFDGTYFYIGDFGNNNNGARTDLKIYKFPLSAIPDYVYNAIATIPTAQIAIINFSYSDQPKPPIPTSINNTKFDCEAMIVDGGKIHLFTKNWIDLTSTHYEINGLIEGNYIANPIETLITNYLVTAADKANGKNTIALLGYQKTSPGNHFMHLLTDYNGGKYFNGNKRQIDLPTAGEMGQAEGLCFRTGTYGYISNERLTVSFITINQRLHSFDITSFVSNLFNTYIFTGNGNWDIPANWSNNVVPPAAISSGSEIIINPANGGQCVLNIPYTLSPDAKLTVITAKNFVVAGNLTIQ
jgi:hypothetical protein